MSAAAEFYEAEEHLGRKPSTHGRLVYAIGDIHGRYDLLKVLMGKIAQDQTAFPPDRRRRVIFCGDYIDRGPESAWVVEALKWIRNASGLDTRMLMGNHEQSLLQFIDGGSDPSDWLAYGGAETLASYGVEPPPPGERAVDWDALRARLLQAMPASHLDFLAGLEMSAVVGDYAFVHAGVRPGVPLINQEASDLLWIRGEFLNAPGPFEKVIVHGHTWLNDRPQVLPHRIGLDTGACETGVLTAVRLFNEDVGFLRAEGPPAARAS